MKNPIDGSVDQSSNNICESWGTAAQELPVQQIGKNEISELKETLRYDLTGNTQEVEQSEELGVNGREQGHDVEECVETNGEEIVHRVGRPTETES